jgi:DNA-binding MarR family transcriptional regulator
MKHVTSEDANVGQRRRRLITAVKGSLRDLRSHLSLLTRQVGANLDLKDVDMDCLDVINRRGQISPGALARHAGLHPATVTGIIDRLERAGWVARERRSADRRAIAVRALRGRNAEMYRLLAGMNARVDQICAGYTDADLELIADFLRRTADAGRDAIDELTED